MERDCVILIPALEPSAILTAYARELSEKGFRVVVVNDGSGAEYDEIFKEINETPGCRALAHAQNRGKGAAIKTGLKHIAENYPGRGVVTADSDGQHALEDIEKLAKRLDENKEALYLGARDFSLPAIPDKSRFGNKLTSRLFRLLYGAYLPDTQTGLRAFPASLINFMLSVPGERFEYEMNALSRCALRKIEIISVPIATIYENGRNETTHFRAVRDSARIYRALLASFIRYIFSSVTSMLLDELLFYLFDMLAWHYFPKPLGFSGMTLQILFATASARVLSAAYNYIVNKKLVFGVKRGKNTAVKYAALCISALILSSGVVSIFNTLFGLSKNDELSRLLIKLPTDLIIFMINYKIQRAWVFAEGEKT